MIKRMLPVLAILVFAGWSCTKQTAVNVNTQVVANTVADANVNVSVATFTPLTSWNAAYEPLTVELTPRPTSVQAGLATCVKGTSTLTNNNFCYLDLATGFRDLSICEKMSTKAGAIGLTTPAEDMAECYESFAQVYGMIDCAAVSTVAFRDSCYATMADPLSFEHPIDGCAKINDAALKQTCADGLKEWNDLQQQLNQTPE